MGRTATTIALMILAAAAAAAQTHYGSTDVKVFRDGRDAEFRDRKRSPLTDQGFRDFSGLSYFETADEFVVTARLEKDPGDQKFVMPTSNGFSKNYLRFGKLRFELGGAGHSLTVFRPEEEAKIPEYADLLFIPFRDLTNGKETYGAGRYIDVKTPAGDTVVINFNLAYNPSCAYGNDRYSCPLPPRENFLQIKIQAGERNYRLPAEK